MPTGCVDNCSSPASPNHHVHLDSARSAALRVSGGTVLDERVSEDLYFVLSRSSAPNTLHQSAYIGYHLTLPTYQWRLLLEIQAVNAILLSRCRNPSIYWNYKYAKDDRASIR
jgi:hypothetical protein